MLHNCIKIAECFAKTGADIPVRARVTARGVGGRGGEHGVGEQRPPHRPSQRRVRLPGSLLLSSLQLRDTYYSRTYSSLLLSSLQLRDNL